LQIHLEALQGRTILREYSKLKERVASYENVIKLLTIGTLDHHRHGLERSINTLNAVNPWRVLQRGYSITRTLPGLKVVADAFQVHKDDHVQVVLASGHLVCRVEEVHHESALNMPPTKPEKAS
jgi:exodeoxyribonuclease VII large subunit